MTEIDVESEFVRFGIGYIVGGDIGHTQTLVVNRIREVAVPIRDLPGPARVASRPLQPKASGGSSYVDRERPATVCRSRI